MKRTKKAKRFTEASGGNKIRGQHADQIISDMPFPDNMIMVHDPSFTAWGWAVIDPNGNVWKTGCIKTEPMHKKLKTRVGDDRVRRTTEITTTIKDVIQTCNVKYMISELPHGSQNAQAAVMIGVVIGLVVGISESLGLGTEWYSEQDAKRFLTGKRTASKDEVKMLIKKKFPDVLWTNVGYKDEAVADALAVYNVARSQSSTLKFLNNG